MNFDTSTIVWALSVVFFSTLVHSVSGFGSALVAMPLLAIVVDTEQVATPLVGLLSGVIAMGILLWDRRQIPLEAVWRLVISAMMGIPIGIFFLKAAYEPVIKIVLALIVITFALYKLLNPELFHLANDRFAYIFGFIGGILGSAYNIHGPPSVIYGKLRKWSHESFRATLQAWFLATSLFIVPSHGLAGLWSWDVFQLFLISLPIVVLAIFLGMIITRRISTKWLEPGIYGLLILIGSWLLITALRQAYIDA